jgi:hypothetical protein
MHLMQHSVLAHQETDWRGYAAGWGCWAQALLAQLRLCRGASCRGMPRGRVEPSAGWGMRGSALHANVNIKHAIRVTAPGSGRGASTQQQVQRVHVVSNSSWRPCCRPAPAGAWRHRLPLAGAGCGVAVPGATGGAATGRHQPPRPGEGARGATGEHGAAVKASGVGGLVGDALQVNTALQRVN